MFLPAQAFSCIALSVQAADKTVTNSLGMAFVSIPAGSFTMGADKDSEDAYGDELPSRRVTISQPFYLGKYEVTQGEWETMMGDNPSKFKGGKNPVDSVSWNDAQTGIERLNRTEGTKKYRLPTEAEWEYAARAGTTSAYSFGDNADSLGQYAWYEDNSESRTHPVGQKQPNPWGLYDMHGNVMEWVQDWYDYYVKSQAIDPCNSYGGPGRVLRGGCWRIRAVRLRSACRDYGTPAVRSVLCGFRLAFSPDHS
jgi:formylglycine-generating enzyme required for sulfatase activity